MSITRRQLLLSVPAIAAGFIFPSFLTSATQYLEETGSPLLVPSPHEMRVITATTDFDNGYQLNIGDPYEEPAEITLREYINRYYSGDEINYMDDYGLSRLALSDSLDEPIDHDQFIDAWARKDSPQKLAYDYLYDLDLGPQLDEQQGVGLIAFVDGPCPGNDYIGVHATDDISLSLLQARLNQLGEGVRIVIDS